MHFLSLVLVRVHHWGCHLRPSLQFRKKLLYLLAISAIQKPGMNLAFALDLDNTTFF